MYRKNKRRKEEICEDYCFSCKDGGLLIICDYKDCLKAYHPECIGKDKTFMDSGERWNCRWHYCFICQKLSKFQCLCCSQAVCGRCIHDAEFVIIKGNKGLCQDCLNLALLYEDRAPADSEGATVDFKDEKKYEFFFVGYWEYMKKKEGLTRESIHAANELLKKDKNYGNDVTFFETGKIVENVGDSEEESHFIVSDYDYFEEVNEYKSEKKRSILKKKSCVTNKRKKSKKKEFDQWGSKSLLEFLHFINQDTSKPMTECAVVSVVMKYIAENKLFDPQKRKRIICNDTLRTLFGKKFVSKHSLSKLLSVHFASNVEESIGDDGLGSSSDDEGVDFVRKKSLVSIPQAQMAKVNSQVKKSCYALVTAENIKLVYLKRSLVDELINQGEGFEKKVVGSFVRVKCDPNDYLQKNSHQLLQVKAVTTSSKGNVVLKLFDRPEDFPIDKLSDDNFTEEECEDLRRTVKDGLLKKLTIEELEQKARSLHKDMINHWIPRELAFLRRRVDQANEKGWRRDMSEYLDRIQLLNDESERQRLLNEFPEIIAEPVAQDFQSDDSSPESPIRSASSHFPASDNFSYQTAPDTEDQANQSVASTYENPNEPHVLAPEVGDNILEGKNHQSVSEINKSCKMSFPEEEIGQTCHQASSGKKSDINIQSQLQSSSNSTSGEGNANRRQHDRQPMMENQNALKVEVIELSDNEPNYKVETKPQPAKDLYTQETRDWKNQREASAFKERQVTSNFNGEQYDKVETRVEDVITCLWYCRTAHGHRAGPFKLSSLKNYFETRDIELEIMVWKQGGREEDAILLEDLIHKYFS